MELEFSHQKVIGRLNRMKNVLGRGKLANQDKLIGEDLDASKQFHSQLQAQNRIALEQQQEEFKKKALESVRKEFERKVVAGMSSESKAL